MDMDERWATYEALRGQVPERHPVGVVVEADGPVVRRPLRDARHRRARPPLAPGTDIAALVRRRQDAFAERCEPVEWKVYGHDAPELGPALTAAGFTPGRQRSVLVAAPLPGERAADTAEPREGVHNLYRVPGQAERTTYPDGDYYLHVTDDLLLGTFGRPWEQTLTVWGPRLLAAVEEELTELLGEPIRRRN
ncbi:DUF2716 domain-containing protein [Streptomyces virginiae]|uniref:DUF2716 domain-containing protein n=1 Tax=Streptomyces virginiae TaxID=1961 RepID=UPI002253B646|nr:DUF2716 domain-containing protein [Streptomyces virginiae]MCX4960438.1 DUF2716 domain-containing protein [Streptomyces virginiae]